MGMALATYRVYPEEGASVDDIMNRIGKIPKVKGMQKEPIAFGLVVLKVGVMFDDKKDRPDDTEKAIRQTEGVKEVEELEVTLIS